MAAARLHLWAVECQTGRLTAKLGAPCSSQTGRTLQQGQQPRQGHLSEPIVLAASDATDLSRLLLARRNLGASRIVTGAQAACLWRCDAAGQASMRTFSTNMRRLICICSSMY